MKKIIIALFALIPALMPAQTEQQSIELPDFVITGRQSVNVPVARKRKPDFISTLSRDFFTPQFSPEELPLFASSEPAAEIPNLKLNDYPVSSGIKIRMGKYSFPDGEFNFGQSYENFLATAKVWGSNIKDYIPDAGYNTSGVTLNNDIFLSTRSVFLPGSVIRIAADYRRDSYNFYASAIPSQSRETGNGSGLISISDSYNRWITFGAELSGNIFSLKDAGLKETGYNLKGLFEFKQDFFTAGLRAGFTGQSLNNNLSGTGNYNYLDLQGYIKIFSSGLFDLRAGVNYSSSSSKSFFAPFGMIEYRLLDGITVSAEINPHTEYFTIHDFVLKNRYFNLGLTDNSMVEYKTDINGMIRYEHEKLFSVSLIAGFARMNNNFYFDDVLTPGKFDLYLMPESEMLSGGLNFTFFPSLYGYFFGEVRFRNARDLFGNSVPYEPDFTASLNYGYDFEFGLGFKFNYTMNRGAVTDIKNTNKLKNFNNLSVSAGYEVFKGFKLTADFQNILNQSNFVWRQYQEKPFDLLVGIEYHW